ncbi:MAG: galactose mutarotase, partial [Verrucomicrobia bacterium]
MKTEKSTFGTVDGREVELFTLENDNGMTVKITNYGGIVTDIIIPDKTGARSSIACGFDSLEGYFSEAYKANSPYFGCLVGRYAGRIKDGRFTIDGTNYQLATNDGPNHLHGGIRGYDKRVWDARLVEDAGDAVLALSLLSEDGEEGYPGTVRIAVEYRLTNANELRIRYRAETDKATPITLTNHTYFNLNSFSDKVLDHVVQIRSDRYLVPDETNVPVGEEAAVAGTAADFNAPRRLGDAFRDLPMGFEHYYVFNKPLGALEKVAEITEPSPGRRLEMLTTEPGSLFYTGRYTSDELRREDGTQ